jgi:pimeloyl-ACP methyl ester carboxylesterase
MNIPYKKFLLIGCASLILLVLVGFIHIGLQIFPGSGPVEITDYHPFKSARAQEKYLAAYDLHAKNWPVPSENRMVETSYGSTFMRISGSYGAPPLVLLHGFGGNSLNWLPNVETLSQTYRVYAIDTITDSGRSIYTQVMDNPGDYIVWLNEVFNALDLGDDINLVGLSYGGWLTAQYAQYYPERLNKIVLLAPAATVLPIDNQWTLRAVLCMLPHRYFTRNFLLWLLEDFTNQDQTSRQLIEALADLAYLAARSFKPKPTVSPTVLTNSELMHILTPALFLVGENERIYSPSEAVERLNLVAPKIETSVIPDAGHDLTYSQADLVNHMILDFLSKP